MLPKTQTVDALPTERATVKGCGTCFNVQAASRAVPAFPPWSLMVGRFVLALVIASAGGAVFLWLEMPLPFILGGMIFCLFATLVKLPVAVPGKIRPPMSAVIGVMLGSSFSPEVLGSLANWILPILGLALFLALAAAACVTYYRKIAGYDLVTSYFAGMPGGLMEMTLLGETFGADPRRVALAHSARILIVVFSLPFLIELMLGINLAGTSAGNGASMSLESLIWLAGTALVGTVIGRALRFPAAALLGPMAVSAVVHATGWTDFRPPADIVMIAQIVLGASIGCRFAGITARELGRVLVLATGSTAILLAITVTFAFAASALTPFSPVDLILAYSPGGLTEMGLIALAINTEVAFVAAHHIVRVAMVSTGAAFLGRIMLTWPTPPPPQGQ